MQHDKERVADLDITPSFHGQVPDHIPTAPTHNTFVAMRQGRPILVNEQLFSFGLSLFQDVPNSSPVPFQVELWREIPILKRKQLLGKSMHLEGFLSFVAYTLAHCVPVAGGADACPEVKRARHV